jgi:hypothetical protein
MAMSQQPKIDVPWEEKDGVVLIEVTSDGTTGPAWIERLKDHGFYFLGGALKLLTSKQFVPTSGVATKLAVLKGTALSDEERTLDGLTKEAVKRNFAQPHPEVACLLAQKLGKDGSGIEETTGIWCLMVMHQPITVTADEPGLILDLRFGMRSNYISASFGDPQACYPPSPHYNKEASFVFKVG